MGDREWPPQEIVAISQAIRSSRVAAGLSVEYVGERCGLSTYEMNDIESFDGEICDTYPISVFACLLESVGLKSVFFAERYHVLQGFPVIAADSHGEQNIGSRISEYLKDKRISTEVLSDRVGIKGEVIEELIQSPDLICDWPLAFVSQICGETAFSVAQIIERCQRKWALRALP
jgi:transcriptional regulator with XRE-family HTH domain